MNDDASSRGFQLSDTTRKLSSSGTSNPKPLETFSVFGEEDCGEPLLAQHVIIDFTPNAEDKECVEKKVCSFWKFINSIPEIQNLKVQPEKNMFTGDSKTEVAPDSAKSELSDIDVGNGLELGQAVHVLDFAEEKNLINTMFEAKLPQSNCSLGTREYKHSEAVPQPKKKDKKKHVCKCIPCRNPKCRNKKASGTCSSEQLSPLRTLSRKMNEWDAKHPKDFHTVQQLLDPWLLPNAVYMITVSCYAFHPLIQRFVRLWRYVQVVSDVITFALSMLCCQCSDAMPLSSSASVETKPSIQVFEGHTISQRNGPLEPSPGLSGEGSKKAQHTVVDLAPRRADTPELQGWQSPRDRTALESMRRPSPTSRPGPSKRQLIDPSRDYVHPEIVVEQNSSNLPGIHMSRKMNKTGRVA